MRIARYSLALVPLAAVWLYAVAQSSQQIRDVLKHTPAALEPKTSAIEPLDAFPDDVPTRATAAPRPHAEGSAAAPTGEVTRVPLSPPAEERVPAAPLPGPYAAEPVDDALALEHPEITDPVIRRRLAPAWAD
jgi:hypothetical protein